MARRRNSVRFWQTGMFIIVIVVAILILSGSLSRGLTRTLSETGRTRVLLNASALAARLEPDFPPSIESLARIRATMSEFRTIYGDSVWVYSEDGSLLASTYDVPLDQASLDEAKTAGLTATQAFADIDLAQGGSAIGSKVIHDADGNPAGVVVISEPVTGELAILDAVRGRLWITFWVSLVVAGLLGFGFSEVIGRRIRAMSQAAAAIAGGDFQQRLPLGFAPGEINDMAESYNRMAVKLGQAFSALQEREREISAVVESMAEGVIAFDAAGTVRVINPEAVRMLDIPAEQLAGVPARALTGDTAVLDVIAQGLSGSRAVTTATLGELAALLHCTPLTTERGEVVGAVLLIADVTEQRRIEEAQQRFVADASHEMRTPIAALKGMLELLTDGAKDDPAVRDDFLRTMQLEVDRLGRLVADLLILAQLEAGSLRLDREPQKLHELLGDVERVMHQLAEYAGVGIAIELSDDELEVNADRDRIVQVLLGFVDNALKHSHRGSVVHLRARGAGSGVVIEVADEGHGISPEQLAHVFDRFYRADESRSGRGGAGLGLAIAKEIVEAHGSAIDVTSSPDTGTTFRFELPRA